MIRFRSGRPEKMGGWVKALSVFFKGVARAAHNWTLLNSKNCLALGTHKKFYIEEAGNLNDITPIRFTDTDNDTITSGAAGTNVHTYTTSVAHGALVGDYFTISGATDVDGICASTYTNPFTTQASGSNLITVNTVVPHFAAAGDTVTFSGTTGFDGIPSGNFNTSLVILEVLSSTSYIVTVATTATTGYVNGGGTVTATYLARLNKEFVVLSTPTTTTLTFQTDTNCTTGAVTGGGAAVTAKFQVSVGYSINIVGGGWGAGTWSRLTWSSPVTNTVSGISMRMWSIDNYGEDLVFCQREGAIFYWDATNGLNTRAVYLSSLGGASDVPDAATTVIVTEERHVVAIGCTDRVTDIFDPLLIRWSNQEDPANWTPAVTNTSGAQRIPMGSFVHTALETRQEILIWTDHSLHSLIYTGPPYTFSLQTIAENTDIIGPNAAVNINNITYWMGRERFWIYTGRVENLPCDVQRYVYSNINLNQAAQVYGQADDSFTEVKWFYCSADSNIVNRFVCYNYSDQIWTYGAIGRTTWTQCPGRNAYPYATDGGYDIDDGVLYVHEYGYDDGSTNTPTPIHAYIESTDFDLLEGDRIAFADRIIPDVTFDRSTSDAPSLTISIQAKKFPGDPIQTEDDRTITKTFSGTVDQFTRQVWARLRGRSLRIRFDSTDIGTCFLIGTTRINVRTDGRQ
jgi:hypothetical protein